jgi:hypothetical protein
MGKLEDYENMTKPATIMEIAVNRSWIWMQEYDPHTGQVGVKDAPYINEARHAFIDGFLEGFQARIFGEGND